METIRSLPAVIEREDYDQKYSFIEISDRVFIHDSALRRKSSTTACNYALKLIINYASLGCIKYIPHKVPLIRMLYNAICLGNSNSLISSSINFSCTIRIARIQWRNAYAAERDAAGGYLI